MNTMPNSWLVLALVFTTVYSSVNDSDSISVCIEQEIIVCIFGNYKQRLSAMVSVAEHELRKKFYV